MYWSATKSEITYGPLTTRRLASSSEGISEKFQSEFHELASLASDAMKA